MDLYPRRGTQSYKQAVSENIYRKGVLPVLTILDDPIDQELTRHESS